MISQSLGLVAPDTSPAPNLPPCTLLGEAVSERAPQPGGMGLSLTPHLAPELRTHSQSTPINRARHHGSHWRDSLPAP